MKITRKHWAVQELTYLYLNVIFAVLLFSLLYDFDQHWKCYNNNSSAVDEDVVKLEL